MSTYRPSNSRKMDLQQNNPELEDWYLKCSSCNAVSCVHVFYSWLQTVNLYLIYHSSVLTEVARYCLVRVLLPIMKFNICHNTGRCFSFVSNDKDIYFQHGVILYVGSMEVLCCCQTFFKLWHFIDYIAQEQHSILKRWFVNGTHWKR